MKRLVFLLVLLLCWGRAAQAVEVAGVTVVPQISENGHLLKLNGYGIRSKFFVKVYVGSLYAAQRLTTPEQVLADSGAKLIRMQFVHSRVAKEKIVAAFAEGLANNAPQIAVSPEAQQFLAFFTADFHAGETVDLFLGGDGLVKVHHAGRPLGSLRSPALAKGIVAIYVGEHPADADLKSGLLGG